jgi:hypothetical protein
MHSLYMLVSPGPPLNMPPPPSYTYLKEALHVSRMLGIYYAMFIALLFHTNNK